MPRKKPSPKLLITLVIVLIAGVGFGVVIKKRLVKTVESALAGSLADAAGGAASVDNVRVSLFPPTATLDSLAVNRSGEELDETYRLDTTRVRLKALPALFGRVHVRRADITGREIFLDRRKTPPGESTASSGESEKPQTSPEDPRPEQTPEPPEQDHSEPEPDDDAIVTIDALHYTTVLRYRDEKMADVPLDIRLALELEASDLTTATGGSGNDGTLRLTGHHVDDPAAMVTVLEGRVGSLADITGLTFELKGQVSDITAEHAPALLASGDLVARKADLSVDLYCDNGVFDAQLSRIKVDLHDAELAGDLRKQFGKVPLPSVLKLEFPVAGPLTEPSIDIETSIAQSILANFSEGVSAVLGNPETQERAGKEIERGLRKLDGLLQQLGP